MEFFNRGKNDNTDLNLNQSIIDFMNNNANETNEDFDPELLRNKEIQQKFKLKSGWRPSPPNTTLDTFQRAVKLEILKSKPKHKRSDNLTKQERMGLKTLRITPTL